MVPTVAFATDNPTEIGHADVFATANNSSCSSSALWGNYGSAPQPTGTGTTRVGAALAWEEGYHDLDLRLTAPDGTTHHFSQQVTTIDEVVYDTTQETGTYKAYERCFSADTGKDNNSSHDYHATVSYWDT